MRKLKSPDEVALCQPASDGCFFFELGVLFEPAWSTWKERTPSLFRDEMEMFRLRGGDDSKLGAVDGVDELQLLKNEAGNKVRSMLHKWDFLGAGLIAYSSPTADNVSVRVLKITPELNMPGRPHFIGWFSNCVGEPNHVSWKDIGEDHLEEMAVLNHGPKTTMGMVGEPDCVIFSEVV